ncbi:FAD-dependent oxidoreductase [Verrucomicrobia bacterium LW23]|nr:FAD-dependent oxidoreductase [Verrucomicrobia bacterium LW23]
MDQPRPTHPPPSPHGEPPPTLTRRDFLIAGAGAVAAAAGIGLYQGAVSLGQAPAAFGGSILGAAASVGHLLRTGLDSFPLATAGPGSPPSPERVRVAIVGGGMTALTAAWELRRKGIAGPDAVRVLELEEAIGGNSSWGRNDVSAYPWGAHYLPLLNDETTHLVPLLEELGIIEGRDDTGAPIYNEHYLCFAPMERLFLHGRWREGLEPRLGCVSIGPDGEAIGTAAEEEAQFVEFHNAMEEMRLAVGTDGRRAFAIPVDLSSADAAWRDLDQLTMAEYMRRRGWTCTALRWYVNYGCRDDYGTTVEETSAWAGIHYYAGRSARIANGDPHLVLTWPEGNGWLAARLRALAEGATAEQVRGEELPPPPAASIFRTGALVGNVERDTAAGAPGPWRVEYLDVKEKTRRVLHADAVIVATPHFVARRIVAALQSPTPAGDAPAPAQGPPSAPFTYAPWMVANITMKGAPEGGGSRLAWDNVIYAGESLGYVMATHQRLDRHVPRTVLTYYHPLTAGPPAQERTRALARTWQQWRDEILAELSRPHPEIGRNIQHMDVWLWGHAMIRPIPGFIWGPARHQAMRSPAPGLVFAHADYSGISIFEEASWHGQRAADAVAQHLG